MNVRLAGFNIKIHAKYNNDNRRFKYFEVETNASPDFEISYTEEEFANEKRMAQTTSDANIESSLLLRKISEALPLKGAFLIHSATIAVNTAGIMFSASSGTGKTTHMLNWVNLVNDYKTNRISASPANSFLINGDKPFVRFLNCDTKTSKDIEHGVPYVYGNIWNGKENYGKNAVAPLKHICFIERSETNFVTKIEKHDAINRIMKQVYIPKDPEALKKTLELVNRLINTCDLWIIHCNMEPESAKIAYETIIGE